MEIIAIVVSLLSLGATILLARANRKNSRKAKIYSEEVFCSTVVVNSSKNRESRGIISDNLLLKVYTLNQGITRFYQIIKLNKEDIIIDREYISGYETILFDSTANYKEIKSFSTKYHAIEYALFSHELSYQIHKTPLGGELWWI